MLLTDDSYEFKGNEWDHEIKDKRSTERIEKR